MSTPPKSQTHAIARLSLPLVIVGTVLLLLVAGKGWRGPWLCVAPVWIYALVTELHVHLPERFFESYETYLENAAKQLLCALGLGFLHVLWKVGAFLDQSPDAIADALSDPIGGLAVMAGLASGGTFLYTCLVLRHLLSGLRTLERGRPEVEGGWTVLINAFMLPFCLVVAHARASRVFKRYDGSATVGMV